MVRGERERALVHCLLEGPHEAVLLVVLELVVLLLVRLAVASRAPALHVYCLHHLDDQLS